MFRKRKKQIFPEGTFIPTKPRVMAILQLCLAFSAILFAMGEPFMGQHLTVKSDLLIFDFVQGHDLFNQLPTEKQEQIQSQYEILKKSLKIPFSTKLGNSFYMLFFGISAYERAWILFSITISLLLLKRKEGAKQAVWILPMIAAAYLISNHSTPVQITEAAKLFPSEEELSLKYLDNPLHAFSIAVQQAALLKAWRLYSIEKFLNETPSTEPHLFEAQVKRSEFAFNVARIETLKQNQPASERQPAPLLTLYLFWNLYFALTASQYKERPQQKNQEEPQDLHV